MYRNHSFLEGSDRYVFDDTLIPRGFHQVDSQHDASYLGRWLNPKTLEYVEYVEGDVESVLFESTAEFIGWVLERKDVLGLIGIDDWSQNWYTEIERSELEIYLSYMRDDAIQ
jgi:hypothetical protein